MTVDITLRFEDESEAMEFTLAAINYKLFHSTPNTSMHRTYPDLVNIQKVPPSHCTCPFQKGKSYTRGSTYGWWVCPRCNKMDLRAFNNFNILGPGISLLPVELRPSNRGPECNEVSPKEWSFLSEGKTQM